MAIKSVKKESAKSRIKDNGHYFLATPGTHPSKVLDLQEDSISVPSSPSSPYEG
jgi:hypothetical protein